MADESRRFYALQFHPEVTHTPQGARHPASASCARSAGCDAALGDGQHHRGRDRARPRPGRRRQVLLGLSGGVDSSVRGRTAASGHRRAAHLRVRGSRAAAPGRGRPGHGDLCRSTGRAGDSRGCRGALPRGTRRVARPGDRNARSSAALFIEVFDEEAAKLKDVKFLAQGTIYPDVIESAGARTGKAHVIKSHHNVGGLPAHMKLKLVEPLRELFKDEVRRSASSWACRAEMVHRHPFPGPGLGVRILGEVRKPHRATCCGARTRSSSRSCGATDLYDKVSQAFAVFLPVRSVGVMGDGRRYDYVIALRAVETIDFMTARWARLPYDFLDRVTPSHRQRSPGFRAWSTTFRGSRRRRLSGNNSGPFAIYRQPAK